MSGTPENPTLMEESVGLRPEEAREQPVRLVKAASGMKQRKIPRSRQEKITLGVTMFTALTLPIVAINECFVPWGWTHSCWGWLGILVTIALDLMSFLSLALTIFSDPYLDPSWVPTNVSEEELRQAREKASSIDQDSPEGRLKRAAVCSLFFGSPLRFLFFFLSSLCVYVYVCNRTTMTR